MLDVNIFKSRFTWDENQLIGRGRQSRVVRGLRKGTKDEVAIKIIESTIDVGEDNTEETNMFLSKIRQVIDEWLSLSMSQHSHAVQIEGCALDLKDLGKGKKLMTSYLAMEVLTGNLHDQYIQPGKLMDKGDFGRLITALLEAIEFFGRRNLSHGELKPRNIMIDKYGDYKIVDFGAARVVTSSGATSKAVYSQEYSHPDLEDYLKRSTKADFLVTCDRFSVGMSLLHLGSKCSTDELKIIREASGTNATPDQYKDGRRLIEAKLQVVENNFGKNASEVIRNLLTTGDRTRDIIKMWKETSRSLEASMNNKSLDISTAGFSSSNLSRFETIVEKKHGDKMASVFKKILESSSKQEVFAEIERVFNCKIFMDDQARNNETLSVIGHRDHSGFLTESLFEEQKYSAASSKKESYYSWKIASQIFNPKVHETLMRLSAFEYNKMGQGITKSKAMEFKGEICGPIQLSEKKTYEGQMRENVPHGRGKMIWRDGAFYEGYFENGVACGRGRIIRLDGSIYEGEWKNDQANGRGRYVHFNGEVYEGDWLNDKQHGKGVETWQDGARFEGEYFEGKKQGKGAFQWADGSSYHGEFDNNNIQGYGEYKWADGRVYKGTWKDNKMEGKGLFYWTDGRIYEGEYKNDKKAGMGRFTWPDGKVYYGKWVDGKQEGEGTISKDGVTKRGIWEKGAVVKWLE